MKKMNGIQLTRIIVLTFFLLLISFAATMHQIKGGGPAGAPSIDSLCPFGGVETVYKYLATHGEFLKRTNTSNFILLGGTIVLAIVIGRFFCGWLCMLGFLQELFGKLGKLLFKKRFVIPSKVDKPLRFFKYIILFGVLYLTWRIGDLIIRPYDPFVAYAHIPAGLSVFTDVLVGVIVLAVSLIASMFFDRFFCKYACPMGAFLGILNKISFYKIKRDASTCINCSKCTKICPVNIDVEKVDKVKSSECINCMECITVCPTKKDTLTANFFGKKAKLVFVAILGIGLYAGIVLTSMAAGVWKTTESTLTEAVKQDGKLNPDNIRGFMTMKEIAETFNVKIDDLYAKLNISREKIPDSTKMKELKNFVATIGEDDVRNAVRILLGMPTKAGTEDKKTAPAISAQKETASSSKQMQSQASSVKLKTDISLKGTTTFKELLDAGLTKAEIEKAIEMPMGAENMALRDFFIDKGLEFSQFRTKIQALIDSKK